MSPTGYIYKKKLPPTEAAKELTNFANYFVDVHSKFLLACLDSRNTLLPNQTDVRKLLFHCYMITIIISLVYIYVVTFFFLCFYNTKCIHGHANKAVVVVFIASTFV